MTSTSKSAPRPRPARRFPSYPRAIGLGLMLAATACGGVAVDEAPQDNGGNESATGGTGGTTGGSGGAAGRQTGGSGGEGGHEQPGGMGGAGGWDTAGTGGGDAGYGAEPAGEAPYPIDDAGADAEEDAGNDSMPEPEPGGVVGEPFDSGVDAAPEPPPDGDIAIPFDAGVDAEEEDAGDPNSAGFAAEGYAPAG